MYKIDLKGFKLNEVKKHKPEPESWLQSKASLINIYFSHFSNISSFLPRLNANIFHFVLLFTKRFVPFCYHMTSWENGLWTNETQVKTFDNNVHQQNTPTIKHSGGRVMIWACFAAMKSGRLGVNPPIHTASLFCPCSYFFLLCCAVRITQRQPVRFCSSLWR